MSLFHLAKKKHEEITPAEIIEALEKLGYFKYTDPADIETLKSELGKGMHGRILPLVTADSPPYQELDPRHFTLDGEDLYESGGVLEALNQMQPLFEKLHVKMEVTDHREEYDAEHDYLNQDITINGKRYVIFNNFKGYGWGEAAQRFADIVNDQLSLQGSEERLYLINGGNDGRAVFLTKELLELVAHFVQDLRECPLCPEDWCKVMAVHHVKVT